MVRPRLKELRLNVTRLGDPRTTAALHLYVAEMEAKRGLTSRAQVHAGIVRSILAMAPNLLLDAMIENLHLALRILRSDFEGAYSLGERALTSATESGCVSITRACLSNLGTLSYSVGNFNAALRYFDRSGATLASGGEKTAGRWRVKLDIITEGRLDEADRRLKAIEASVQSSDDRVLYVHRHTELTRADLCAKRHQFLEALNHVRTTEHLASMAGVDRFHC